MISYTQATVHYICMVYWTLIIILQQLKYNWKRSACQWHRLQSEKRIHLTLTRIVELKRDSEEAPRMHFGALAKKSVTTTVQTYYGYQGKNSVKKVRNKQKWFFSPPDDSKWISVTSLSRERQLYGKFTDQIVQSISS